MKVKCIDDHDYTDFITAGKIYTVSKEYNGHYYFVEVSGGWRMRRFILVIDLPATDLPDGHRYCKCGTITTNVSGLCCDCMPF